MAMLYADSQLLLVPSNPHIRNFYKLYSDAYSSKAHTLFTTGHRFTTLHKTLRI